MAYIYTVHMYISGPVQNNILASYHNHSRVTVANLRGLEKLCLAICTLDVPGYLFDYQYITRFATQVPQSISISC